MLADAGVPLNSEFPVFVNPNVSVRNRVAELERAQTGAKHGSDHGKGVQRFLMNATGSFSQPAREFRSWRF